MKLITAQELQNMKKEDLLAFFNELSRNQAKRDAEDIRWSQSLGKVTLKADIYADYDFD